MDEVRALNLLGIATRAGQVTSGDDMVERDARAGRAAIVLLDAGASENTRAKYRALCAARDVPLCEITDSRLGRAIGKDNRMIVSVRKGPLAENIIKLLT